MYKKSTAYYKTISLIAVCTLTGVALAQLSRSYNERQMGTQPDGKTYVSSQQTLTPIGHLEKIEGARPKDIALSPDGKTLAVLAQGKVLLYTPTGELQSTIAIGEVGPLGIVWTPDNKTIYASLGGGRVAKLTTDGTTWKKDSDFAVNAPATSGAGTGDNSTQTPAPKNDPQVTGLALSPDATRLYVALGIRNSVAVIDTATNQLVRAVPVGIAPYHVQLSPDGKTLYVSCRGGRKAEKGEATADSAGTEVRVDTRTDAALRGAIAIVDTTTGTTQLVEGGRQPSGMAITKDGKTLYVTNSDDDTISVLDTATRRIQKTFSVHPPAEKQFGSIPTDCALSPDERTLYITCGGLNAVAAFSTQTQKPLYYAPTGWFPIALAERDNKLFVASSKGLGSQVKRANGGSNVHGTVGTIQFLPLPTTRAEQQNATAQVVQNSPAPATLPDKPRKNIVPVPVPLVPGEPSVFKHVVFIIKENQTYDGIFGDMPEGNGDKSLCTFPEEVTPNHHALAREFVLLDNTYTSGTNSADGHQWTVSAIGNGYIEQNYAAHTRSYPYDGGDPLAYSPAGFLWTAASAAKKNVRVYGEFVNKPRVFNRVTGKTGGSWSALWEDYKKGMPTYEITSGTDNAALRPHLHPNYIGFPSIVPDQWRADKFLEDWKQFETNGKTPDLCILLLPNDHTMGTSPTTPTPRASVADNDLALGRIVEGISNSKQWKDTLILVIEDDSQYGVDHVDGHRTVALCISPYTKRKTVIHTTYNHPSFVRTIGLINGFPALNRFDATATPLTNCFTAVPDLRPYAVRKNNIPLDQMNPAKTALTGEAKRLAIACENLDWSDVDKADAGTVARAIWLSQKPGIPFPIHAFHPSADEDDK